MTRTLRTYAATAAFLLASGTLVSTSAAPASAKTDNLGCSSGETTYTTAFLIDHGFSPEFLAQINVNLDGIVCARPLSPQQQAKFCGAVPRRCQQPVIFGMRDNTRGAAWL